MLEVVNKPRTAIIWRGCIAAAVAARADLSAAGMGARRLPALQPRPQRRARLHRALRAGVPAERHGDHPAHELLLAAGLACALAPEYRDDQSGPTIIAAMP